MESFKTVLLRILKFLIPSRENWKVVVLCLISATTFWFFNALNKTYTTNIRYPLTFEYTEDSVVLMNTLPDYVTINLTAGGWDVLRKSLGINTIPLLIPIDRPVQTKIIPTQTLLPQLASLMPNLQINFIVTDTIFIDFEPYIEKEILVTLDSTEIDMKDRYFMTSQITLDPKYVILKGPARVLDTLKQLSITLDKNGISKNFSENIQLTSPHPLATAVPNEINCTFSVEEYTKRTTQLLPTWKNTPRDFALDSSELVVNYFYPKSKEDAADSLFQLIYNFKYASDSTLLPTFITIPEDAKGIEIDTVNAKISVR